MKGPACVLILLAPVLFATTTALPPLTQEGLIGVWEAVEETGSIAIGLYRMDIRKEPGESYLVKVRASGTERIVARLVSFQLHEGNVTLRYATAPQGVDKRVREFVVEGYAAGEGEIGAITGKLRSLRSWSYPESAHDVRFRKGAWTRLLGPVSETAEKLIQGERNKPTN